MTLEDLALLSRRGRFRVAALVLVLIAFAVWASARYLQPAPPSHIVLASGLEDGLSHQYAQRYIEILARAGVTVEERMTRGTGESLGLLQDPHSGVDIAFTQGGVARFPEANNVVMLASLYYVPLWIFYSGTDTLNQINELVYRRIAFGVEGSGARAFAEPLFALNGLTSGNVTLLPMSNSAALRALRSGEISAASFVDGARNQAVWAALHDPNLKLMSFERADAYHRLFPYITKLTLPPGVIDFAHNIPKKEVALIATKAMLAARDGLHPALTALLVDAAREIHGEPGFFEEAGEFPGMTRVDLRVSSDADQHKRFGPTFLYRYLPFWAAAMAERTIIICYRLPRFCSRFSTTCRSCCAGVSARAFIAGMASWLCWNVTLPRARAHCPLKHGWPTWIASNVPSRKSVRLPDSPAKPIHCASTSGWCAVP